MCERLVNNCNLCRVIVEGNELIKNFNDFNYDILNIEVNLICIIVYLMYRVNLGCIRDKNFWIE